MAITVQHSEEILSIAYAYAVAAQSGLNIGHKFRDYGIDLTFSYVRTLPSGKRVETGYDLHCQLKSTINSRLEDSCVVYDLEVDTYNLFAEWTGPSPCYLLLMRLPRKLEERVAISEDVMQLRDCCYWHFIEPGEIIRNKRSKTIRISRENQFTPEALKMLMDRLRNGKQP